MQSRWQFLSTGTKLWKIKPLPMIWQTKSVTDSLLLLVTSNTNLHVPAKLQMLFKKYKKHTLNSILRLFTAPQSFTCVDSQKTVLQTIPIIWYKMHSEGIFIHLQHSPSKPSFPLEHSHNTYRHRYVSQKDCALIWRQSTEELSI